MEGSICVLGHSIGRVEDHLEAFGFQRVYRLCPQLRIDLTISFLNSEKTRRRLASFISVAGSMEASSFCSSNRFEVFKALSLKASDLGGIRLKAYLDIIDREDLAIFALDVAFSIVRDHFKNLKFAVFLHEPHGIHDLAFYFALEYFGIPIYNYKWLPGTPYSLILLNIFLDFNNPKSLGQPAMLVENIDFCHDRYVLWKQVIERSSQTGVWPHIEYAAKVFNIPYPLPKKMPTDPSPIPLSMLKNSSPFVRINRQGVLRISRRFYGLVKSYKTSIFLWACLSYPLTTLLAHIKTYFDRVAGALIRVRFSYANFCYSPRNTNIRHDEYVYVPLHLQPECTSLEFGGSFSNQIRMLKKIRSIVPENIKLLIKDNFSMASHSHAFARRKDYFILLKNSINNVEFVSQDYFSKDIIISSMCVFSVNGTACLEAATLGIPAIIAGLSIYANHPMIGHLSDFSSPYDYSTWLRTKNQARSLMDEQIDQFYKSRNHKIHMAVPYGKWPSIENMSASFASISVHYYSI